MCLPGTGSQKGLCPALCPAYISRLPATYYIVAGTLSRAPAERVEDAMEEKGNETIARFDRQLTTDHIQMMKIFLPCLPPAQQDRFAVYIKFSELQYALRRMNQSPRQPIFCGQRILFSPDCLSDGSLLRGDHSGILELLDELMPFGSPKEQAWIRSIQKLLADLKQMREMMDMLQMLKELFPDGFNGENGSFDDIGSILSGMGGNSGAEIDLSALMQMAQMFGEKPGT